MNRHEANTDIKPFHFCMLKLSSNPKFDDFTLLFDRGQGKNSEKHATSAAGDFFPL